jgi:predicted rRNA pseudouridine synthase
MEGVLILNKPAGITSHDACDKVKTSLNLKKVGHAGTLDPMVTGVLVIALENSTKALRLFNGLNKTYLGTGHLHEDVSLDKLKETIRKKFIGEIKQTPPKRSRVKRVEREREILEFDILKKEGKNFEFLVSCQAGTYIRKLIDDLGKELKIGAHMTSLHRTMQGPFSDKESIKVEDLRDEEKLKKSLISLEKAARRLNTKVLDVDDKEEQDLRFGKFLKRELDLDEGEIGVAINSKNQVVALIKKEADLIKTERAI